MKSRIKPIFKFETSFDVTLTEQELGALDAILGYSPEAFLKAFKKEMGYSYVKPYEDGVRSLHERLRPVVSGLLSQAKNIRAQVEKVNLDP